MHTTARIALASLGLASMNTAHAGGLGVLTHAGFHAQNAYFYNQAGDQGIDKQYRPNYGAGLDILVGDKDDKVIGLLRGAWVANAAPTRPDTGSTENPIIPPAHMQGAHHVGSLGLGVQWGLLGDPTGAQLTTTTVVGSGFITTDNTEYVFIEVGVGGTYNLADNLQAHGTIAGTMRNRKTMSFGPDMYMGIRYLFD